MGTLEVVGVDEQSQAPRAVGEIGEHRARQELVPERLPESLDLAQRLRVLRPALHVPDAVPPELLLELGLAPPRRVLASLIGQHLARRPVVGNAPPERLHHQRRSLVVRQRVRHHVARAVVHEPRQVQPLVLAQQEREDVRLPQLVGLGALEAPWRVLPRARRRPRLRNQPLLVQDAAHLRLRDPESLIATDLVPDPPRPEAGVLALDRHDRVAPDRLGRRLGSRAAPR